MSRHLTILFLITCLYGHTQIQETILDENFNGFPSDNISIQMNYIGDLVVPYDTAQYVWRQTTTLDNPGFSGNNCSLDGTPFMQAGNFNLADDWGDGGLYSTSMTYSGIDMLEFDSVKLSIQHLLWSQSSLALFDLEFSNDDGISWTSIITLETQIFPDCPFCTGGTESCESAATIELDVSSFQGENISLRLKFEGWRYMAVDNLSLIGYRSESAPISGCTYESACNYNPEATEEDSSCLFIGTSCDDDNPDTSNDIINANCNCAGETEELASGCTDSEACNYNSSAINDDGSCEYLSTYDISGNVVPVLFDSEEYNYTSTEGNTYEWSANLGAIVSGQGTSDVGIVWAQDGLAEVCVIETSSIDGCEGEQVCLNISVLSTNIEEPVLDNIQIYPNPASSSFSITIDETLINAPYQLYDSQGKIMLSGVTTDSNTIVQTGALSSGVYTLTITGDKYVLRKKIILKNLR
jgi:hypothetical protein